MANLSIWDILSGANLFTKSPIGQWWFSQLSSDEQAKELDKYYARTDQQIEDATRIALERGPEALATFDASNQQAWQTLSDLYGRGMAGAEALPGQIEQQGRQFMAGFEGRGDELMSGYGTGFGNFIDSLRGGQAEVTEGYRDRYRFAEEELEGYGEQQQADIDRRFDEEEARITQDLISRGLLSSTESAGQFSGSTERRSAEQRRLGEDLTRNRINVLGGMKGEELAALERMIAQQSGFQYGGMQSAFGQQSALDSAQAGYDAAFRGDVLGAQRNIIDYDSLMSGNIASFFSNEAINRSNIFQGTSGDLLNAIMGINYLPPPQNQLPWQFGQASVGAPSGPSSSSQFWGSAAPAIGAGIGTAAAAGVGAAGAGAGLMSLGGLAFI